MTPKVEQAITQLRASFPEAAVTLREDGEGGAYVTLEPVILGSGWLPTTTWIGFRVTFQYPNADVYPHYVSQELHRANGLPLPPNMTPCVFEGRPAYQVSRRSNRLNPALDTASLKLHKVICWLQEQA
jgi:hypothetical protein